MNRRQVLAGIAAGVPLFAGCSALSGDGGDGDSGGSQNTTEQQNGTRPTETPLPPTTAGAKMAETVQQTLTRTATPTPTATTRTAAPTTTAGRTTGAPVIDPSNLTTYTSETDPFSIKYPAGWTIDETPQNRAAVKFTAPFGSSQLTVGKIGPVSRSVSLDRLVTETIRGLKQSAEQGKGTINSVNRREVTLPNGHRAIVVEITGTTSSNAGKQAYFLITLVNGTAYLVSLTVPKRKHTATAEQGITEILTSLTVSETAPSAKNQTKTRTPGTTNIDLSNLATYTSDNYPFSIKYPAGWVVDKTDTEDGTVDGDVKFDIPNGVATEFAQRTQMPRSMTLERIAPLFNHRFKQRIKQGGGDYKKLGKRTVTLSNGHRAVIIDFRYSLPMTSVLRATRVLTLVGDVLYTATIWVPKRAYTPAVERSMNTIVTSLTVTETATTGNRTTSTTLVDRRQP